jgi:hypothetical protein
MAEIVRSHSHRTQATAEVVMSEFEVGQTFSTVREQFLMALKLFRGIKKELPLVEAVRMVDKMGLLVGMGALHESEFYSRLFDATEQKENMADYLLDRAPLVGALRDYGDMKAADAEKDVIADLGSVFFESGSTIAYLIGKLATKIAELRRSEPKPPFQADVVTNNFWGTTAFANLVRNIQPTWGKLERRYFGFFPFDTNPPAVYSQALIKRYMDDVERLWDKITLCSTIFGTSSEFSFLAGPIVRSFQNALFKRVMHAALPRRDQRLYLLVHFAKLVGVHSFRSKQWQMGVPAKDCYCVFPPHKKSVQLLSALGQQPKEDGAEASRQWHSTWANGSSRNFPAGDLWEAWQQGGPKASNLHFDQPWLNCAANVRIVIGMPEDFESALNWLRNEIIVVNEALKRVEIPTRYEPPKVDKVRRVCEIKVRVG